jgi:5'-methylthioinosine phosphorylase
MIAFIGGTSLTDSTIFNGWSQKTVKTPYGKVTLKTYKDSVFLQRHDNPPLPPHKINHRANIWALKHFGVQKIVAINSVGSLKLAIKPGAFVIPDDFISFSQVPTFYENEMRFIVPLMDADFAAQLYRRCETLKMPIKLGGIYIQTQGPRLETKAEINMLKRFGDVIGMTMASEVTLCLEYDLPYASICSIDNYCHGIVKIPLTMDEIQVNAMRNLQLLESVIESLHRATP